VTSIAEQVPTVQKQDLPIGWSLATLEELVGPDGVFVDGDWVESKDQDPDGEIRLIQLADIGDGEYRNRSDRFLTHEKALELKCTFLKKDDILIARMPDPLGRACIFPGDRRKSVTVVDVAIVRSGNSDFNHRWLMYFINAPMFRSSVASLQSGSTRKRISRGNLARIGLPVPPREQQNRIVSEIEKQFSRLDEAVASLKRTKANLKRYKAAVLKAAVEGKLTEDWRNQHPNAEPASKLLERILAERRKKWSSSGKYVEPEPVDAARLPPLPKGWACARLEQLGMIFGGLTKNPKRAKFTKKLPYLRVANVYANELRLHEIEHIGVQDSELEKLLLLKGDLLVVEGNGSKNQIGRLAVWDGSIDPCVHQNHLIKARLSIASMSKWILFWLLSPIGRNFIEKVSSSTSGLYTLSVNKVGDLPIIVPSVEEQDHIVAEVERRLSVIEELEATVEANLTRADRLRQSVLSQAFAGKLVCVNANQSGQRSTDIQMAKA
jgi:type I restriction enzyme, S subunit